MLNLIMGTAGHIDHGKTTLVQSLTGIDCDTHPEEKKRGITINLGFAYLKLANNNQIGIVDVPGHKDFINTMVAGASGINFILLIVAANEGVMPQTVEHLRICQSLGVKNYIIVLTKIDLVDEQLIKIAEDEIKQLMSQNNLNIFSLVKVSVITGEGIANLKNEIYNISSTYIEEKQGDIFRVFIDRIFSVKGYGTVVTGSVLGGHIKKNDSVYLLPGGKKITIRKMEKHYEEIDEVDSGNRIAINLTGIKKEQIKKGNVLTDRILATTRIVDAKIKLFPESKKLKLWSKAIILFGTNVSQVKIHLMDKNELQSGDNAIVQIHMENPCVILYKDRFILRNTAGDKTIGCGEIIDVYPLLHKRRPDKLIQLLKKRANGGIKEFLIAEIEKKGGTLSLKETANYLDISQYELKEFINCNKEVFTKIPCSNNFEDSYLVLTSLKENLINKLITNITTYHKNNSLDDGGRTLEEIISLLKKQNKFMDFQFVETFLRSLEKQAVLKRVRNTWALPDHFPILTEKDKSQIDDISKVFKQAGMHTLLENEIVNEAKKNNIDENKLLRILKYLTRKGELYKVDESYIYSKTVDECRTKLVEHFSTNDKKITVAEFRDLIKGNRKICLLLFKLFDREGLTYRDGDYRKPVSQL